MNCFGVICLLMSLFSSHLNAQDTKLEIYEIEPRAIMGSHQNKHLALISNVSMPKAKITLVNLETEKGVQISDGRMPVAIGIPFPWEDGFALCDVLRKSIYFIDGNGEFQKQVFFRDLKGWDEDFVVKAARCDAQTLLFEIHHRQDPMLFLANVNLDESSLDVIFSEPRLAEFDKHWQPLGDQMLSFVHETGEITLCDSKTFKKIKTLRREREPFKREKVRPGRSSYRALVDRPRYVDQKIVFKLALYRDRFGDELEESQGKSIVWDGTNLEEQDEALYAVWKNKRLVFDLKAYEFRLDKTAVVSDFHSAKPEVQPELPKTKEPSQPSVKESEQVLDIEGPVRYEDASQEQQQRGVEAKTNLKTLLKIGQWANVEYLQIKSKRHSYRRNTFSFDQIDTINLQSPAWVHLSRGQRVTSVRGFDGQEEWYRSSLDRPSLLAKRHPESSKRRWQQALPILLNGGSRWVHLRTDAIDGRQCDVYRAFESTPIADLWIEQASGLLVRQTTWDVRNGKTFPETIRLEDYREAEGVLFPHKVMAEGRTKNEEIVESIDLNPKLDPDFFKPWPKAKVVHGGKD